MRLQASPLPVCVQTGDNAARVEVECVTGFTEDGFTTLHSRGDDHAEAVAFTGIDEALQLYRRQLLIAPRKRLQRERTGGERKYACNAGASPGSAKRTVKNSPFFRRIRSECCLRSSNRNANI